MTALIVCGVFLLVVAAVGLAFLWPRIREAAGKAAAAGEEPSPYVLRPSLFTAAERSFFGVLEHLERPELGTACKVRLADVFGLQKGLEPGKRQRALNRISSKHVDFLLVRKSDGRPVLGIELDDRSHEREDRMDRDDFVDGLFESAGLPLLRVKVRHAYDVNDMRRQIEAAISSAPSR